jgi:hypothetical protein
VQERLRAVEAPQAPSGIEEATAKRPARHGEEAEGLQDLHAPASLDNQPSQQPVHHCSAAGEEVPATTSPLPNAGTGEQGLLHALMSEHVAFTLRHRSFDLALL